MRTKLTREQWLIKAIYEHLAKVFKRQGEKIPDLRVSIGIPHGRKGAIGQWWSPESSKDKKGTIFVCPTIEDSVEVLDVLSHELVHAVCGEKHKKAGHGPVFKALALKIGLEGKMTHARAGKTLLKELKGIAKKLGPIPHSKLNLEKGPTKKQSTRMLKMECSICKYICRASKTVILEKGTVICPLDNIPMDAEIPEGDE